MPPTQPMRPTLQLLGGPRHRQAATEEATEHGPRKGGQKAAKTEPKTEPKTDPRATKIVSRTGLVFGRRPGSEKDPL